MKTLRKFMMALFAIACIGMTVSCNKDDNKNNNGGDSTGGNSMLVGTWNINSLLVNGTDMSQMLPNDIQVVLNANGSGTIFMGNRGEDFHWSATSSTLTIDNGGSENIECAIVSLTNNECVLTSSNMSFPGMGQIPGVVTITLIKSGDSPDPDPDTTHHNNYSTLIIGTWQMTQTLVNGHDYTTQSGDIKLVFNANGRGVLNDNGETENNDYSWSINGNIIDITPDHGSAASFTIVSLDGHTCVFTGSRMPGVEQDLGEVCITMTKVGDTPDPDPEPFTGSIVNTAWAYNYETSFDETHEGIDYHADVTANINLAFTTATTGTVSETISQQISVNGVPVPEMSGTESEVQPFTYTYDEATHTGTINVTATHMEDGEEVTETIHLTFTAGETTLTVTNNNYDPESDMIPQTVVFTRVR